MSWVETESLSFTRVTTPKTRRSPIARSTAETLRLRLEDRFETMPAEVTVVIHTNRSR